MDPGPCHMSQAHQVERQNVHSSAVSGNYDKVLQHEGNDVTCAIKIGPIHQ